MKISIKDNEIEPASGLIIQDTWDDREKLLCRQKESFFICQSSLAFKQKHWKISTLETRYQLISTERHPLLLWLLSGWAITRGSWRRTWSSSARRPSISSITPTPAWSVQRTSATCSVPSASIQLMRSYRWIHYGSLYLAILINFILSSMDSVRNWVILQLLIIFTGYDYSNWPPCDGISKITGFIGYDVENHFGEKLWRANWGCLQVMLDVLHLTRPINLHYKFCLDFIDSRENWMLSLNILI